MKLKILKQISLSDFMKLRKIMDEKAEKGEEIPLLFRLIPKIRPLLNNIAKKKTLFLLQCIDNKLLISQNYEYNRIKKIRKNT